MWFCLNNGRGSENLSLEGEVFLFVFLEAPNSLIAVRARMRKVPPGPDPVLQGMQTYCAFFLKLIPALVHPLILARAWSHQETQNALLRAAAGMRLRKSCGLRGSVGDQGGAPKGPRCTGG